MSPGGGVPLRHLAALGVLLVVGYLIYVPGLGGFFLFDDMHNVVHNESLRMDRLSWEGLRDAALSSHAGPLGRPLAMLSFALDEWAFGLDSRAMKRTNVLIHLLNGAALFAFAWALLELRGRLREGRAAAASGTVALLAAALWMLHPLNLAPALYVVQRMTSLATLFTLLAMTLYLAGRWRSLRGRRGVGWYAAALGAWTLAALSKENALLLPVWLFLVEWLLLSFPARSERGRRRLVMIYGLVLGGGAVIAVGYLAAHPQWILSGYELRSFTLGERLLTEARALWFYIGLLLFPSLSRLGIFHDDFPLSHDWLDPATSLFSVLGWAGVLIAALVFARRYPWLVFGVLFFLVGHLMESTVFALELVHEHRNYLPTIGFAVAGARWLTSPALPLPAVRHWGAGALVAALAGLTLLRADVWGDGLRHIRMNVANHPGSARAHYDLGRAYYILVLNGTEAGARDRFYHLSRQSFAAAIGADPNFLTALGAMVMLDDLVGSPAIDESARRLIDGYRSAALTSRNFATVQTLRRCNQRRECTIPSHYLERTVAAALENPRLPARGPVRAQLAVEGSILAFAGGRPAEAVTLAEAARDADPADGQLWINLGQLLIDVGRVEEARGVLEEIRRRGLRRGRLAQRLQNG